MLAAVATLGIGFAPEAKGCSSPAANGQFNRSRGLEAVLGASVEGQSGESRSGIVGMWIVTFYVGTTTQMYDAGLEQFYGDGNEMTNSRLFSPTVGNICFGAWEASGPSTFKYKHIGWTFDTNGNFTGTFRLSATIKVNSQANTFTGTYSADILDPAGNVIPGTPAGGNMRGKRFGVN
jgi:hypothetical protein